MPAPPILDDDRYCYCCGSENPEGLHVRFEEEPGGVLATRLAFASHHAGRGGRVHPGFLTLLIDELAVQMLLYQGVAAVSSELRLRTHGSLAVGDTVVARAWRGRARGRLIEVECEARVLGEDRAIVDGVIVCMQVAVAADGGVERFMANRRATGTGE